MRRNAQDKDGYAEGCDVDSQITCKTGLAGYRYPQSRDYAEVRREVRVTIMALMT